MTITLLPSLATALLLVFARVGALVMLLPGLGDRAMPARIRLALALLLTLILLPVVRPLIKVDVGSAPAVVSALFIELVIGVMLGLTARFALSALEVAGVAIAQQLGLAYVMTIDPTQGGQAAAVSNFLTVLAITLILVTDLHHLSLGAIHDSYLVLAPGVAPDTGDMAQLLTRSVGSAFSIGVQISAPFLAFSLVFNAGLGVLSKLMPQMPVFFVAQSASIFIGFVMFAALLAVMMGVFLGHMEGVLSTLIAK